MEVCAFVQKDDCAFVLGAPTQITHFIVPSVDKDCGEGSVFVYRGEVWRRVKGG